MINITIWRILQHRNLVVISNSYIVQSLAIAESRLYCEKQPRYVVATCYLVILYPLSFRGMNDNNVTIIFRELCWSNKEICTKETKKQFLWFQIE